MQIVRDLAGYSMGRSDLVRRAMAKKKKDVMAQERAYFIHGLMENGEVIVPGAVRMGVAEEVAAKIFDEMASFASYAFNKSHATGYGVLSVQTAWLKVHYPVQFMAALMNSVTGSTAKIAQYIQYCKKHDFPVLPPDINKSQRKFSVDRDAKTGKPAIRFGLGAIKGTGHVAVDAIVREREQGGPFRDIYDFARRVGDEHINKRVVESLIRAGAFDVTGANRAQLLMVYERALDGVAQVRKKNITGQVSLFGGLSDAPLLGEEAAPKLPNLTEHPARTLLAMEKEVTGVYITGHPLDEYRDTLEAMTFSTQFLEELSEMPDHGIDFDGRRVKLGGILVDVRSKATKANALMGFVVLEDLTGQVEGLVFPRTWEKLSSELEVDKPVILSGRLSIREDEEAKLIVEAAQPLHRRESAPEPQAEEVDAPWPQARRDTPKPRAPEDAPRTYLRICIAERAQMNMALPILSAQPGGSPVLFRVDTENVTLLSPESYWCTPDSALMRLLGDRFGAQNVRLVHQGGER